MLEEVKQGMEEVREGMKEVKDLLRHRDPSALDEGYYIRLEIERSPMVIGAQLHFLRCVRHLERDLEEKGERWANGDLMPPICVSNAEADQLQCELKQKPALVLVWGACPHLDHRARCCRAAAVDVARAHWCGGAQRHRAMTSSTDKSTSLSSSR